MMVLVKNNNTHCIESCGENVGYPERREIIQWVNDLNINDCNFAYDDVIYADSNVDVTKLFSQTTYGYMLSGAIDVEITNLFVDIKTNKQLMENMSPEIIYLLNISTCSIKQLFKYVYMLYICKFLANNGASRCQSIDHFKYSSLIAINNINLIDSINDELRSSEVVDAYIGFTKDILIKKYYYFLLSKLDTIERDIVKNDYSNVELWMSELKILIQNIINYNGWFIIELNNYYSSKNSCSPIFYVNDRMITFYYGEIQLNYIAWWINYIAPNETKIRMQNRLERSMLHYYENIKESVIAQTNGEVEIEDI